MPNEAREARLGFDRGVGERFARDTGHVPRTFREPADFARAVGDRPAHLQRDFARDALRFGLERAHEAFEERDPLGERDALPFGLRALAACERGGDLGVGGEGAFCDDAPVDGR